MIITIEDMRRAGICKDARFWFARHNLDWKSFVKSGIELQALRDTDDAQNRIDAVEAAARERLNDQR